MVTSIANLVIEVWKFQAHSTLPTQPPTSGKGRG